MAQPRRPKGESGPAKSSKHLAKAVESGFYEDTTRQSALDSLLGATTATTSSKTSSGKKGSSKKSSARQVEADPTAVKVNKKTTEIASSSATATTVSNHHPISTITAEDILAFLSRIDKKSSGDMQVLRSVNALVGAYAVPKDSSSSSSAGGGMSRAPSDASSTISSAATASQQQPSSAAFVPDEIVSATVPAFCEQLQQNAYHPNVAVRRGFASCLLHLLTRGSEVRQAVGAAIAKTFAPWLALIGDQVNGEVSRPAKEALEKTFPVGSSKRVQLFSKFGARACRKLLDDLTGVLESSKGDFVSKNNSNNKSTTGDGEADQQQHEIKDTIDTRAGAIVAQLLGALNFLITELSSSTAEGGSSNNNNNDALATVRKDVAYHLAGALGYEGDLEASSSMTSEMMMSATKSGKMMHADPQQPLSFAQKKMKNKKKGADGVVLEDKPAEGAAVFGSTPAVATSTSSTNMMMMSSTPSASYMGMTEQQVSTANFLPSNQQKYFGVFASKCLPPANFEDQQDRKPVFHTSFQLQQIMWDVVKEMILFACSSFDSADFLTNTSSSSEKSGGKKKSSKKATTNDNDDDAPKKEGNEEDEEKKQMKRSFISSLRYILSFIPKTMTSVLFLNDFAVQSSFWNSLISTLHTLSSSTAASSHQQQQAVGNSYFSKSLQETLLPAVVDVLDNVAEGDIKNLPVPLLDALSSFVLLLQRLQPASNNNSSFITAEKQDRKSFAVSVFDKLYKIADRELEAWKSTSTAKTSSTTTTTTTSTSNAFVNSMRSLIEFTGTVLQLIFSAPSSSEQESAITTVSRHCLHQLVHLGNSDDKLFGLVNSDALISEILKLPSSTAATSKLLQNSSSSSSSSPAAKMFLDLCDRFAGWFLLSAKNKSQSPEAAEIVHTALMSMFHIDTTMSGVIYQQVVKRWLNLENPSDEMTREATMNLKCFFGTQEVDGVYYRVGAEKEQLPKTFPHLSFNRSLWFFREVVNSYFVRKTKQQASAQNREQLILDHLTSDKYLEFFEDCIKASVNFYTLSSAPSTSNSSLHVKTIVQLLLMVADLCDHSDDINELFNTLATAAFSSPKNAEIVGVIRDAISSSSVFTSVATSAKAAKFSEAIVAQLLATNSSKKSNSPVVVNSAVRNLKPLVSSSTVAQRKLWDWLTRAVSKISSSSSSDIASSSTKTVESVFELIHNLLTLSKTRDDEINKLGLKVLTILSETALLPLAGKPAENDSFLFVTPEVKQVLGEEDFEDEEEEEEEEIIDDEDENQNAKSEKNNNNNNNKSSSSKQKSEEELRELFASQNQAFLRLFNTWANASGEIPGGSSLIVDFAQRLDEAVVASLYQNNHNINENGNAGSGSDNDEQQQQGASSSSSSFAPSRVGHLPLLAASLRAQRFPTALTSIDTWNKNLIEEQINENADDSASSSSSYSPPTAFSLIGLLDSESAKRFSIHDFAVAQFPTSNLLDFAYDAGVSLSSLENVGRMFVALAEALHATGFKGDQVEKEQQGRRSNNKSKKQQEEASSDEEYEDEEEEEEDEEQEDVDQQQQTSSSASSSLPAPDAAVGSKLILPVMQMLSVRNLWTTKVRESLKFILSWCLNCLLPISNNNNNNQSTSNNNNNSASFLNSSAVAALAQTCVSICINYSEKAPFLLTGPLALLSQMYTTTKDVRYDRLLRAIYSSVANAWASDVWRFSPVCFCPWPGSALDSLLWKALMPRGVSLPKEAVEKLRRVIGMAGPSASAAATSRLSVTATQEEKNLAAINNAIHAMFLLSILPENVAASSSTIEVNHVVQAMRTISSTGRASTTKRDEVFISGLAVFAALSRCVVLSPNALPEVAGDAVTCLTQAYKLELLPAAGKFAYASRQQESSTSGDGDASAASSNQKKQTAKTAHTDSRKIIQALTALRHGVKAHLFKDDGLTSTMNLCVLDIGCSLGAKLQQHAAQTHRANSYEEEQSLEAEEQRLLLVAFDVSKFLSSEFLSQDDLRVLRASASTVDPIARFVIGTHFWLCSRPLKNYSTDEFVSKATTIVNLAAQLAVSILIGCRPLIMNSAIMSSLVAIFGRPPLRNMNGRQQAINDVAKLEKEQKEKYQEELASGQVEPTTSPEMSERSKLARILAVSQKQLSLSSFKRHANFLMGNAKMRVTAISYFCLSYVYLSLSDDPSVSESLSSVAVVQAADLMLCGLNLKDASSGGRLIIDTSLVNDHNSVNTADTEEDVMSPYLEINKVADPKWLQPAAKSPVVGPSQLRAHVGRWAAACLGLLIQRPVIVTLRHWREGLHHTARDGITKFINNHFSPYLSKMALIDVVAHAPVGELNTLMQRSTCAFHPVIHYERSGGNDDYHGEDPTMATEGDPNVTIEVDHESRNVTVRYNTDEIETRIAIKVPVGYPLSTAHITDKDIGIKGVSEAKRRSWLLRMSASLLNGSASLWSAVEMFCVNIKKEFEGVEPCVICYMVVSNNELPTMQCKVCKNAKFHRSCLTQWWSTAPASICPMCRSPWFAS